MRLFFKTLLLSCIALQSTFALANNDNECHDFHIQISNMTKDACLLIKQTIRHGNLIMPAPNSILSNDSKRFDISQSFTYGPAIELSYQCGEETIHFSSKQNLCFLEAGNITGEILDPIPEKLTASYTAISGSYFWKKSGSINWVISPR